MHRPHAPMPSAPAQALTRRRVAVAALPIDLVARASARKAGLSSLSKCVSTAAAVCRAVPSALAFDRAALYFRRAIELKPDAPNLLDLKVGLGDALANAGRPAEAAREFLEAANTSSVAASIKARWVNQGPNG